MKVGDYVRTKKGGYIGKIYNINEFREPSMMYAIDIPRVDDFVFMGEDDFKSNPNIIDLIQIGDFVNGHRVSNIFDEYITTEDDQITIDKENIKSIVTKQQFSQMEYKVGE